MTDGSALDSFFSYNDATRTFSINTQDTSDAGTYNIRLNVKYSGSAFAFVHGGDFIVNLSACSSAILTNPGG